MNNRHRVVLLLFTVLIAACAGPVFRPPANALGPYSSSVEHGGLTFFAGKIGSQRGPGVSFADEASSALDALEAEMQGVGLGLSDCVSVTVYLTDMDRYAEFNEIYGPRFETPPARACVAVRALPGGARVEIQAIAASR